MISMLLTALLCTLVLWIPFIGSWIVFLAALILIFNQPVLGFTALVAPILCWTFFLSVHGNFIFKRLQKILTMNHDETITARRHALFLFYPAYCSYLASSFARLMLLAFVLSCILFYQGHWIMALICYPLLFCANYFRGKLNPVYFFTNEKNQNTLMRSSNDYARYTMAVNELAKIRDLQERLRFSLYGEEINT